MACVVGGRRGWGHRVPYTHGGGIYLALTGGDEAARWRGVEQPLVQILVIVVDTEPGGSGRTRGRVPGEVYFALGEPVLRRRANAQYGVGYIIFYNDGSTGRRKGSRL